MHGAAEDAHGQQGSRLKRVRLPIDHQLSYTTRLTLAYWSWKILLLAVALASPGPGYDTSTRILLETDIPGQVKWQPRFIDNLVAKLTRWDAIYFTTSSARGHLYEQEWAFSQPAAKVTSLLAQVLPSNFCNSRTVAHAFTGILISHVSHFLAVLTLYQLTRSLIPSNDATKKRIAFTAACIHIVTPGGLFLSAFNGEASFALFNFLGMTAYLASRKQDQILWQRTVYMLSSGMAFGISTMIRSNGLLSGLILAWDAFAYVFKLNVILSQRAWRELVRLVATVLAGSLIAAGYFYPQLVAYLEYCTNGNTRPWCERLAPSIYTWVQSHYWGVGFLRYWTPSNLPLFALAAPMIFILLGTGWISLSETQLLALSQPLNDRQDAKPTTSHVTPAFVQTMARFALPQVVLAALATTSFHVQIINRICTGYPTWYIVLAMAVHVQVASVSHSGLSQWLGRNAQILVRASIMYAIVQGGLYASFMPPA